MRNMENKRKTGFIYDLDECSVHYKRGKTGETFSYILDRILDDSVSSLPNLFSDFISSESSYVLEESLIKNDNSKEDSFIVTGRPYNIKGVRESTKEISSKLGFELDHVFLFPGINLNGEFLFEERSSFTDRAFGCINDFYRILREGFSSYKKEAIESIEEENNYDLIYYFDDSESVRSNIEPSENLKVLPELSEHELYF